MMKTSDYTYELPPELIAQHPAERRDHSRMLVYHRDSGAIEHRIFSDLPSFLRPGDGLVLNETRVQPARLLGVKETGGAVEFLLLKRLTDSDWEAIVQPGRRLAPGVRCVFGDGALRAEIMARTGDGGRIVRFQYEGIFEEVLERLGQMPLPPYIREKLTEPERYQTVYARVTGSAAAPTAGLHFTPELLTEIQKMDVDVIKILLHVGLGTFRPVQTEDAENHKMHAEYFEISQNAAQAVRAVKARGGRVVAVGTTSVRTLETAALQGEIQEGSGMTDIFLYPGKPLRVVDALITNFHLPQSTLLMLVAAMIGREETLRIYEIAVRERYRFYSFGDCCLIL